jgi:thioredoxin 1
MMKLKSYDALSDLTDKHIDLFLEDNNKCIVLCWKDHCPYCSQIFPLVQSLAIEMNDVSFAQINLGKNRKTTKKYKISTVPTVLVFHNNKFKKSIIGMKSKITLKQDIHLAFASLFIY